MIFRLLLSLAIGLVFFVDTLLALLREAKVLGWPRWLFWLAETWLGTALVGMLLLAWLIVLQQVPL